MRTKGYLVLILLGTLANVKADDVDDFLKEIFSTTASPNAGGKSLEELIKDLNKTEDRYSPPTNPNGPSPPVQQQEKVTFPRHFHPPTFCTNVFSIPQYCDNGAGICVQYFQCQDGNIITDGTGLIDIRFSEGSPCDYLQVCCKAGNVLEQPATPPKLNHAGCGYRNAGGVGFKITGARDSEAEFGEFPWMTAVLKEEVIMGNTYNLYQCGGSLITPR